MADTEAELLAPLLLIAMPQILDPFFHRSVVLLVHHDAEGSLGFIINRPTAISVAEILQGMEIDWGGEGDVVAHFGGPVQPQLGTVLFSPVGGNGEDPAGAAEVFPGVSLSQHVGTLSHLASAPPERFRLLLGYAGWGAGQLVEEILRNDWLTAPAQEGLVFADDTEQVWRQALESVGVDPGALPSWSPDAGEEGAN
ncbi:MAG TPA: YqgE/AlgH family protein [Thermoanaerobaculia bacterium]|nr:YqgE/AlgH family protein [Thermoanaerobaculia bacterium]